MTTEATAYQRIATEADVVQYDGTAETREFLLEWTGGAVRATTIDGFPIVLDTGDAVQTDINLTDYVLTDDDGVTFYVLTAAQFAAQFEEIPE
jgi:hypothetical protein